MRPSNCSLCIEGPRVTSFIWNVSRGEYGRDATISFASLQKNTSGSPSAEPSSPYFFVTSLSVLR